MMTFDAAAILSARAQMSDEGAITRMSQRARDLRGKGHDIVALTIGEPDFDTPQNIRDAAKAALDEGQTHYAPVPGIADLRAAIADKLKQENGLGYAASSVVLANGAKQAITNAILSIIGPGDEVIIPAPYWLSYAAAVRLAQGTPVVLPSNVAENYKVPVSRIADAITERTRLIIINSPSNPTGAMWTRAELDVVAKAIAPWPKLMVMSDEIYEYIVFDGKPQSFGALPGMLDRTITINGFSKGFAMTGWRLGYAAAAEPIARAMLNMQSTISAGANMFVQKAALAALSGPRDSVEKMRLAYKHRRDMVLTALRAIPGLKIGDIPAAFYAFPDISAFLGRTAGNHVINSTEDLCVWLMERHGVGAVPGSAFGSETSIRLSFAASEADLRKALERLTTGLSELVSA